MEERCNHEMNCFETSMVLFSGNVKRMTFFYCRHCGGTDAQIMRLHEAERIIKELRADLGLKK